MVILKIWLGALAALALFLFLQSILQQHSERIEHRQQPQAEQRI